MFDLTKILTNNILVNIPILEDLTSNATSIETEISKIISDLDTEKVRENVYSTFTSAELKTLNFKRLKLLKLRLINLDTIRLELDNAFHSRNEMGAVVKRKMFRTEFSDEQLEQLRILVKFITYYKYFNYRFDYFKPRLYFKFTVLAKFNTKSLLDIPEYINFDVNERSIKATYEFQYGLEKVYIIKNNGYFQPKTAKKIKNMLNLTLWSIDDFSNIIYLIDILSRI